VNEKGIFMLIILYEPQIPQNAGNIVRTCAVTGSELIMVRPLGFSVSDRWLKRAGLDYWEGVNVQFIDDLELFLTQTTRPFYFFSSKTQRSYTIIEYTSDAILIFGSETSGLPKVYFERWPDHFVTIPMVLGQRCLNLSNSVAVGAYEVIRQVGL
jgi:tRNA (cytidine/uridine-2'-O-)-methyltransferase